MSAKFSLDDYVDVAERISQFSERFPDGSLQSSLTRMEDGWLCKAYAYRSPTDEMPGVGHAFEPVPGKTPYTRDSEAQNAETAAWGRAIVALGFKTKKIASAQEVKARQGDRRVRQLDESAAARRRWADRSAPSRAEPRAGRSAGEKPASAAAEPLAPGSIAAAETDKPTEGTLKPSRVRHDAPTKEALEAVDKAVTELAAIRGVERRVVVETLDREFGMEWRDSDTALLIARARLARWAAKASEEAGEAA